MSNKKYETVSGVYHCSPTNSTFFTNCCNVAICNYERKCPLCDGLVIGHDSNNEYEIGRIRWSVAFKKN